MTPLSLVDGRTRLTSNQSAFQFWGFRDENYLGINKILKLCSFQRDAIHEYYMEAKTGFTTNRNCSSWSQRQFVNKMIPSEISESRKCF